jgi:hypothetical protein
MYPDRELRRLAAHKASLRRDITLRRAQCVEAAALVARPLEWLDRALVLWRRVSPFVKLAAVPLGLLAGRRLLPRHRLLGSLLRWGPLVAGAVRGLGAEARGRPGSNGQG